LIKVQVFFMPRRIPAVLLVVIAGTAACSLVDASWTRLWPPAVALLVIIATRHALLGLLAGGLAGAVMLAGGDLAAAAWAVLADHLAPSLRSPWKQGAIVFTLVLGGFAAILEAGGGFRTLLLRVSRPGRDRARQLETAAAGLGLLCFFDGLANSLVVGRVGRDLADRSGVARVKLAYIADSTSSAVACVAFISTWIAFQLSMIGEAFAMAGREVNPYSVFLASIPFNFYCWFTLVMMFVAIRQQYHPGPMRSFVDAAVPTDASDSGIELGGSIASAMIPLTVLLASFFIFFLALGSPHPVLPLSRDKLVAAFGSDAGPLVLVLASVTSTVAAAALFPRQKRGRLRPAAIAFSRGVWTMVGPVFILLAAWILGSVIGALGTAELIAGLAARTGSTVLLPSLVFLTGSAVSFSTGTSWGTMGLLFPLAVPAAAQIGLPVDQLPIIVAAVFSGAVFGDHCSPFSDTTIVTSISCGVEPHDHVRTQIPYALITASAAIGLGFLPAGCGIPAPACMIAGSLGLLFLPTLARRFGRGSSGGLAAS
jgi:tetracycline resistance efflux pump